MHRWPLPYTGAADHELTGPIVKMALAFRFSGPVGPCICCDDPDCRATELARVDDMLADRLAEDPNNLALQEQSWLARQALNVSLGTCKQTRLRLASVLP